MGQATVLRRLPATHPRHARKNNSEAVRVGIGHLVTLLEDDGSCLRCLLTDARCVDAVRRAVDDKGDVITTRDPLGCAILNARLGQRCRFEEQGRMRSVWVQAIDPGPVLGLGAGK